MKQYHVLKKLNFDQLTSRSGRGGGGGGCGQNKCYHVAAVVISFNLICKMTVFWKSWILTFWPPGPGVGVGDGGNLQAKLLLPCCCLCDSIQFDMQHHHDLKQLNFNGLGWGGGLRRKIFATILLQLWSPPIWYATWPCSEKVEFWLFGIRVGGGGWWWLGGWGSVGKIFATMLVHSWFPLIWYKTRPCSEKDEILTFSVV